MSDKIKQTFDSRDARLELARLSKGMDAKTRAAMSTRLELLFQESQEAVHVLSGALRASGRRYISRADAGYWRGTITYGGHSKIARWVSSTNPTPRDDDDAHTVDYAAIENNLEGNRKTPPGTPHHFFEEGDIQNAFFDIIDIAEEWLTGDPNARRRSSYGMGRLARGQGYTPRGAQ